MILSRKFLWLFVVAVIWLPLSTLAVDPGQCEMCGKPVTESSNWFIIQMSDGDEKTYGCAGCGLSALASMSDETIEEAKAEDFLRRKLIDASEAFYLRGTEIGFCCEPYWLAFASREEAERFAKGFGGEVLNFEEALDKAQQDHPHHHH